jgi:hypothetical protein
MLLSLLAPCGLSPPNIRVIYTSGRNDVFGPIFALEARISLLTARIRFGTRLSELRRHPLDLPKSSSSMFEQIRFDAFETNAATRGLILFKPTAIRQPKKGRTGVSAFLSPLYPINTAFSCISSFSRATSKANIVMYRIHRKMFHL